MEAVSNRNVVMDCPVLRECKVCGEHKPQTDFYKLAPTKRAKEVHCLLKEVLGMMKAEQSQ